MFNLQIILDRRGSNSRRLPMIIDGRGCQLCEAWLKVTFNVCRTIEHCLEMFRFCKKESDATLLESDGDGGGGVLCPYVRCRVINPGDDSNSSQAYGRLVIFRHAQPGIILVRSKGRKIWPTEQPKRPPTNS